MYVTQVVPELMAAWSPPVKTPVMLKVFRSHTMPSPHPWPCLVSGTREEVLHCVSSDVSLSTDASWSLTRGFDQLTHMLVTSSSMKMLNGIQHTTSDLRPATSFHPVLVKMGTSLQTWPDRLCSCFSGTVVLFIVKHLSSQLERAQVLFLLREFRRGVCEWAASVLTLAC